MKPWTQIVILSALLMLTLIGVISSVSSESAAAEAQVRAAEVSAKAEIELGKFLAMALSVSTCSVAAGYAVAKIGTAAIASSTERPEIFGRTIIFAGLAEGIAIYGLLAAFLIWLT